MPSVSVANFENEELLSARLLSFMAGNDQSSADSNGYTSSTSFASTVCPLTDSEVNGSTLCSPLHRNGSTPAITTLQDRATNGFPTDVSSSTVGLSANSPGFISGSCTPPPTASTSVSMPPVRNLQSGAPPYSALTSPCVNSKLNSGANIHQLLPYGGGGSNECHSLQNSPFYNHYPLNGNVQSQLHRQLGGISPGPVSTLLPNGVPTLSTGIPNLGGRNGICQDTTYTLNLRPTTTTGSGCPQRELFPNASPLSQSSGVSQNIFGSGLLMQDRLHYYALAQKYGFIVGPELERVKENSCRSTSQSYGRIAAHFRHRYGETEAKTKAAYLQIGVRVPSKDHVSEIVGKGGQKIKLIREETGALITTPGEHEEHVFIIEAPPEIAMRVAHHLSTRAQEITQSKLAAGERRRGSTSSQTNGSLDNGSVSNFTGSSSCTGSFSSNGGNGFLIPNGCAAPSSGILSLSSSATNSPLHPTNNGTLSASLMSSGGSSNLRTTNGNLFPNHLSSLPASPCNNGTGGLNGQGQNNGLTNGGSMFLGNTTPGSRILLARGRISVPQEMVGKIIGTQGSIITTIQKDTGTEIKSPPKEAARGPNATSEFEISAYQGLGLSSNQAAECRVQQAKQLIGHLVMRQLERRASEEVEDASGSSNLSSEANPPTPRTSCTWMWPDVAQMDSQEAREVLDRILAESKNKTRRAKELAAATTVSTGPSPTSNSVSALATPGSMINMNGCHLSQASVLAQEPPSSQQQSQQQQQQHFHPHLLNSGLFDQSDATTDCNDINHHQVSINDSSSIIPTSPFSPQSNHYINRQASTTLCDDVSQNGTRGGRMYSPRALSGFNVPEANELLTTFPRVPAANLPSDLWNSAPNFSTNGPDPTSNQLRTLLGSGSTLNTLFTSSPPPHPSSTDPALQTHSELNGGSMIKSGDFEDNTGTNLFSFNDCGGHVFSSGFSSGGDLSPTILMHYRNQHQDLHQPLTRRHSDWVVNSSNLLAELSNRGACGVAAAAAAAAAAGMLLGRNSSSRSSGRIGGMGPGQSAPQQHEVNNNNNNSPFNNSSGFDLIKALDQLCLSSPPATNGDDSHAHHAPSTVASMPHCPPGFEPLQQQPVSADSVVFTLNSSKEATTDGTITSLIDPWSTNDSISNSPFLSSHAGASQREFVIDDGPLSKSSLLRRLFSNPPPSSSDSVTVSCSEDPDTAAKVARINAIWSQSVVSNDNAPGTTSNEASYTGESVNKTDTNGHSMSSRSDTGGLFGGYDLPDLGPTTAVMDHTARCGTIGEGRRRRRPSPSDVDPLALPVTSAIASITEVA